MTVKTTLHSGSLCGWAAFQDGLNNFHLIPLNDTKFHTTSEACYCEPTQDFERSDMFIHHALDQREHYDKYLVIKQ